MRRLALIATLGLLAAALPARAADVAWLAAAGDADIDKAFAQARSEKKPVLLYWGAKWCPPCNQLKATLFNRQDFIERSHAVVPVMIDGDLPGAQKLGTRFKVRGYPTMVLMTPDGAEITRLPGEADAPQVMAMLQQGLSGGRAVKALLADAKAGKPLSGNEWRALALYSWDTDQDQVVPEAERPGLLAQLSAACPANEAEASTRLLMKALAASDDGKGLKADASVRQRVRKLLADPAASRAQMDTVVNFAPEITKALTPTAGVDRQALVAAYDSALRRLERDATLSRGDRLSALVGRVDLARLEAPKDERHPKLSAALLKTVREHAARDDREITDSYERQAVITGAAHLLARAGLWAESDALLKANLAKSHSPYYLMSQLGSNARKLGKHDESLRWLQQAYETSEGPATRLQWGSSYLVALVDLAPKDGVRIEKAATQIFSEAGQDKGAFYERSARSLQRVSSKLSSWNTMGDHTAVIDRLRKQLDGVCGKLDAGDAAQRATCGEVARKLAAPT
ncbi:MAG: thioredoxin family protein [Burkholderiales bacterium]|nr:thioredoxin family protein [Burkholderiales bacterium]